MPSVTHFDTPELLFNSMSARSVSEKCELSFSYNALPDSDEPEARVVSAYWCRYTIYHHSIFGQTDIKSDTFLLDFAPVDKVMNEFKSLHMCPLPVGAPMGLDGTSYELAFTEGFGQATYGWWQEGPAEWAELIAIAHKLLKVIRREARARGFQPPYAKNG
jgi:hypothetical protein